MICAHCGNEVKNGYTLCGLCGAEFIKKAEAKHTLFAIMISTAITIVVSVIWGILDRADLDRNGGWVALAWFFGYMMVYEIIKKSFVKAKWWRNRMEKL